MRKVLLSLKVEYHYQQTWQKDDNTKSNDHIGNYFKKGSNIDLTPHEVSS